VVPVNIITGDQFKPEFLKINPNHRMPAIVDHDPAGGGDSISVFESCAILIYLAEKTGQFLPSDPRGKFAAMEWVLWQAANFGAKIGEFNYFNRLGDSAGDQSHALHRYADEANRLYGVLNWGLYNNRYLGGDAYGIADMAVFPWANNWHMHGQDIEDFKHVKRWLAEISERPGVQRGMNVGEELTIDPSTFTEEEKARFRKLLFNQRAIPTPDEAQA
jgi:GSH-dependent disulfide-bond oxidoreductase